MSIIEFAALHHDGLPPPQDVFEFAERAVDYVRRAVGMTLDYTPETLPILDHWLDGVPRDRATMVELVAATAGAYFGEVVRKALGGEWVATEGAPPSWRLRLTGGVELSPVGFAAEAILEGEVEGYDGSFDVPPDTRAAVEQALSELEVPEDEYYSLSGRLETLMTVVDLVVARRANDRSPTRS